MTHSSALLLALLVGHLACFGQVAPQKTSQQIDSILAEWQTGQGPGCAVAISRNDSILYSRGFGLANLEDAVPNSPQSVYYLASLAKQFTGYCLALLIRDGNLKPDDDVRTYLPWLPDYGRKISVANLLYHTSGLRDQFTLLPFVGFNLDGQLSQEMALGLIKKQRTLNFPPGEKFSYCNTNYILLAEILSKVSGKSLAAFADSAIFRPLQMNSSRFVRSSTEIIKNRANSYAGVASAYGNVSHNIYTQGDGGLFSSVSDMAKWMRHLYQLNEKDSALFQLLTTPGRLNNGHPLAYAMGIIPDQYGHYRRLMHKGALAGYKNFMAIYPQPKLGIIILTNGDDGPKTNRAMEAILGVLLPLPPAANWPTETRKTVVIPAELAGDYITHSGSQIHITLKEGKLFDGDLELSSHTDHRFRQIANPQSHYHFIKVAKGYGLEVEKPGPNAAAVYRTIPSTEKAVLKDFIGSYSTTEVDFNFTISLSKGRLWLSNNRHGRHELRTVGANDLYTDLFFVDHFVAIRSEKGKITALEYASGDTAGLLFEKH